ncbi:MAG: flagellar biosynthetic protein FliR [Polyangiaceae bacterium]
MSLGDAIARLYVSEAITFGWVLSRVAGFVVTAPFPGADVPQTARLSFTLSLAWVVTSFAAKDAVPASLDLGTVMTAAVELGCGAAMGFVLRILIGAADMTGEMIAHAIGLSTGAVLNPEAGSADPTISRAFSLVAMLIALGLGAHRVALAHVLESFRSLPVGSVLAVPATFPALASLVGETLGTSLRLALPIVAVSLLTQLALALIARAAPAMQIFNVGLSVTLAGGLVTLVSAAGDLGAGFAESLGHLPDRLGEVLLLMARR